MKSESIRIDPANAQGIHMVDIYNGCERIYIPCKEIPRLISQLKRIYGEYRSGGDKL